MLLGIPVWEHLLGLGIYQVCLFKAMLCAASGQIDSFKGCRLDDAMWTILAIAGILLLSQHISEFLKLKLKLQLLIGAMCGLSEGIA